MLNYFEEIYFKIQVILFRYQKVKFVLIEVLEVVNEIEDQKKKVIGF